MNKAELNESIRQFIMKWMDADKGQEDKDDRSFWIDLFQNVLDVQDATDRIDFQKRVIVDNNTKKIDAYIPETKVLIEQKSKTKRLDEKIPQGDGENLTPYEQALRYNQHLPYSEKARWIVTSNFKEIWIYDMDKNDREREPIKIYTDELRDKHKLLNFLIKQDVETITDEVAVSVQAGNIVGEIYDAFLKEYGDEPTEQDLKELNKLCVRIVFCLYAEDADLFESDAFYNYLKRWNVENMNLGLEKLFKVLDTPVDERRLFSDEELASFPYVNGELFSGDAVIPPITEEIKEMLLEKASLEFDWSKISPTIFGAVFESTLNPETRRSGGMHYTSVENIHKVIDPLFMDELNKEFEKIVTETKVPKTKIDKLHAFQDKIASLKFLDPACGSGNFLTETYLSLRGLENRVLNAIIDTDKKQMSGQMGFGNVLGVANPIKVSINQFYGIEINDFAVTVARTAMWIAENQMMQKTSEMLMMDLDFLPLKSYTNIVEANALRIDWNDVISNQECDYIMGNPPFVGQKLQTNNQKDDLKEVFGNDYKGVKMLDYVSAWYFLSAVYMKNTAIQSALVSTNSITQGEPVSILWKTLFDMGIKIIFCHRTFRWDSEAQKVAAVHCVIVGFSYVVKNERRIYDNMECSIAKNINGYLIDADNVSIERRGKSLCNASEMTKGAQLIDGGGFLFENEEEKQDFIKQYPESEPYIYRYYNAKDFLNNTPAKYCLYLKHCPPEVMNTSKGIKDRINKVYEYRANSKAKTTNILKDTPSQFFQSQVPENDSIIIPVVSSENRSYIPMSFMKNGSVYTNALFYIDNATIYDFGILTSNVHMAWVMTVCGRLEMRYRYSNDIVYNNFPWPTPTEEQKQKIEQTAQGILDARSLYPESSLADLYDPLTMPKELRDAHTKNDIAVMQAYGFDVKNTTAEDCVAKLMEMYQELTNSNS